MLTVWGEKLDKTQPLSDYPRPQLARDSFLCLNGQWSYAFCPIDTYESQTFPKAYDGDITVPFSPEAPLSGVNRMLQPEQALWYNRSFTLPPGFNKGRVLLHFGAVDQLCKVFVNGVLAGCHEGGYLPFTIEITQLLVETNDITVAVVDYSDTKSHSKGKQKLNRGGIWYTPQSGIWQTVWVESVPCEYITELKLTPQYKTSSLQLTVQSQSEQPVLVKVYRPSDKSHPVPSGEVVASAQGVTGKPITIEFADVASWSPDTPYLYPIEVTTQGDSVKSYFAMREFSVERASDGYMRLFLNGSPLFHTGLLDQGYWPDGLYTPPSDQAMIFDIQSVKAMGFNMLRKHIKIEPMRWYYHCDRLGMLVWQDMVNGGGEYNFLTITTPVFTGLHRKDGAYKAFARQDQAGRRQYQTELEQTVRLLYNCPSIALWVPFNEGWGQFDALDAVKRIRAIDDTRTIDHASGWHDQGGGDVKSLHVYFKPVKIKPDGRAIVLSEFGGYALKVEGHALFEKDFGYKKYGSKQELEKAIIELYEREILPNVKKGLCATVYTQVSDVEDELNGLFTYDRRIVKLESNGLALINQRLKENKE